MGHLLDRPIWSALVSRHVSLAVGGTRARRYHPSVSTFAATAADDEASLDALAGLVAPGDTVLLAMTDAIVPPRGFEVVFAASLVQMVTVEPPPPLPAHDVSITRLGWDDAADMLELALLTKPGPFTLKSQSLGAFWGVKRDGKLIAMAGQRMKQPGFTELSGVCTHPEYQGKGLGRLLSVFVSAKIFERSERGYLHAYATNLNAIQLYETIGFRHRVDMNIAILRRPD